MVERYVDLWTSYIFSKSTQNRSTTYWISKFKTLLKFLTKNFTLTSKVGDNYILLLGKIVIQNLVLNNEEPLLLERDFEILKFICGTIWLKMLLEFFIITNYLRI